MPINPKRASSVAENPLLDIGNMPPGAAMELVAAIETLMGELGLRSVYSLSLLCETPRSTLQRWLTRRTGIRISSAATFVRALDAAIEGSHVVGPLRAALQRATQEEGPEHRLRFELRKRGVRVERAIAAARAARLIPNPGPLTEKAQ